MGTTCAELRGRGDPSAVGSDGGRRSKRSPGRSVERRGLTVNGSNRLMPTSLRAAQRNEDSRSAPECTLARSQACSVRAASAASFFDEHNSKVVHAVGCGRMTDTEMSVARIEQERPVSGTGEERARSLTDRSIRREIVALEGLTC